MSVFVARGVLDLWPSFRAIVNIPFEIEMINETIHWGWRATENGVSRRVGGYYRMQNPVPNFEKNTCRPWGVGGRAKFFYFYYSITTTTTTTIPRLLSALVQQSVWFSLKLRKNNNCILNQTSLFILQI